MKPKRPVASSTVMFSSTEVGELCDVSPKTVRQWIAHGELYAVITPGRERKRRKIPYDDLLDFMKRSGYPLDDLYRAAGREPSPSRKILIVDDEKRYADEVKRRLEEDDRLQVKVAYTGARGVALIAAFQPDLLLLDLKLPDLKGDEVLEAVKGIKASSDAKILVYSANTEQEIKDNSKLKKRLKELGAKEFVAKIDHIRGIRQRIYEMLDICRRGSGRLPVPAKSRESAHRKRMDDRS